MHHSSAAVLAKRGVSTAGWTSRRLTAGFVDEADLVLTATAGHRADVALLNPGGIRRTFCILQFGALAGLMAPASLESGPHIAEELREQIAKARGLLNAHGPKVWDLADPMGKPFGAFARTAVKLTACITEILKPLQVDPVD